MKNTIILLGAGASAADGAPIQGAIFKEIAKWWKDNYENIFHEHNPYSQEAILPFFRDMFGIDFLRDDLDKAIFPTAEEALGILDLAFSERRGFGSFSYRIGNRPTNYPTVDQMRMILLESISSAINNNITANSTIHQKLTDNLKAKSLLDDVVFVTTNYDLLIDAALSKSIGKDKINYCAVHEDSEALIYDVPNRVSLLKLHGSLDWKECPSCHTISKSSNNQCSRCGDFTQIFMVPPTFYKDMGHLALRSVWYMFEQYLKDISHIVFCGYSFPDADIHLKYVLKRREVLGVPAKRKNLKVSVFNSHTGKSASQKTEEEERYKRFFVAPVNYHPDAGFDEFSTNPEAYL